MNFDFLGARMKHWTWTLDLRAFLDGKGGLTMAQATSHRDCDLGKWLYSDGLAKYGAILEMKELETEHETLHRIVKTVIELKGQGKLSEAESELARLEPVSKKIMNLLTAVEDQVLKNPG